MPLGGAALAKGGGRYRNREGEIRRQGDVAQVKAMPIDDDLHPGRSHAAVGKRTKLINGVGGRAARKSAGGPGRWSDRGHQSVARRGGAGSPETRKVSLVYGALHGIRGIVDEDFVDLTQETTHNLELVAETPSSALGSTREKPDLKYCQEILKTLKAHEIRYFLYVGGNDFCDTVRIVAEEARKARYSIRCIHVPKTIDNDLVLNDQPLVSHRPHGSSCSPSLALISTTASLPGIYIGVVMGRHAGFLVAASALRKSFRTTDRI